MKLINNSQYKYYLLTAIYLFLLLSFSAALGLGVRSLPDIKQTEFDKEVWVFSGHPIIQNITPRHDGFNLIILHMRNVALWNQLPFTFTISDNNGQILRTIELNGYNIGDRVNVRFQFDPIIPSKDQTFKITMSSDSPQNIAIGVGYNSPTDSLAYQTYFRPTKRSDILVSALSEFSASFFRPRFLITLLFFGLLGYFVINRLTGRLNLPQDL